MIEQSDITGMVDAYATLGIAVKIENNTLHDYVYLTVARGLHQKTKTIQKHRIVEARQPGESSDMAATRLVRETLAEMTKDMRQPQGEQHETD